MNNGKDRQGGPWWKRFLGGMLACLCVAAAVPAARAFDGEPVPLCDPSEVDVSGVIEKDGRLIGEIRFPEGVTKGTLKVDCAVPRAFTQEQQVKLKVEYPKLTKKLLKKAMDAVGQDTKKGVLYQFVSSAEQRLVQYQLNERHDFCPDAEMVAPMRARGLTGLTHEAELRSAREAARKLLERLGAAASDPFLSACRDDRETYDAYSFHGDSWLEEHREEDWAKREAKHLKNGRPEKRDYSFVRAFYELRGLPVMDQYYWRRGKDVHVGMSAFYATVGDDGTILQADANSIPSVVGEEPCALPERSWRELLQEWAAKLYDARANARDERYEELDGGIVTSYACYDVLTAVGPCWVGLEQFRLEPGWYMEVECRQADGDILASVALSYTDAATMSVRMP